MHNSGRGGAHVTQGVYLTFYRCRPCALNYGEKNYNNISENASKQERPEVVYPNTACSSSFRDIHYGCKDIAAPLKSFHVGKFPHKNQR